MLNSPKIVDLFKATKRILWALFLITLPVTSFPYFPEAMGGRTLVRPLSLYPLILLLICVTLPRLFTKPLPKSFLPLFAFTIAVLISSVYALGSDVEPLFGVGLSERLVRNLVTLGIGLGYYLTVSLFHENWKDMRFTIRWLFIGFTIALGWGSLQAIYVVHYSPRYFHWMNDLQHLISIRKLFPTRISGMTYEPKWFAEQICIFLLPWLLGAILQKRTFFPWRLKWITIEWLLLIWAAILIFFTFSRTGLLIFVVLVVLSFSINRIMRAKKQRLPAPKKAAWLRPLVQSGLLILGTLAIVALVGSQNRYFSRLWRYWTEAKQRNRTYLEYIAFQQRMVYVETAYRIFEANPLLGVGLGNYAFYFGKMMPDRLYRSPEIIRLITPEEGRQPLVTPKNLYARLLAESGMVGFFTFLTFLAALCGCILYLWYSPDEERRYWALSTSFGFLVCLILAFSSDSLALPNIWIVFGLITAAGHLNDHVALGEQSA